MQHLISPNAAHAAKHTFAESFLKEGRVKHVLLTSYSSSAALSRVFWFRAWNKMTFLHMSNQVWQQPWIYIHN